MLEDDLAIIYNKLPSSWAHPKEQFEVVSKIQPTNDRFSD